jgi:HAD superfamily hydrolase (TIGR01484 family)
VKTTPEVVAAHVSKVLVAFAYFPALFDASGGTVITPSATSWHRRFCIMPKVQAIFSDYDGTLCPLEVRREDAFMAPRLKRLLTKVSKRVQLGIITTKDLDFIKERVPFARGISATSGLEMEVDGRLIMDERALRPNKNLEKAYHESLAKILQFRENIVIEGKESGDGILLAFCIDWRLARNWEEAHRQAMPLLTLCKDHGLFVIESVISPFANVYPVQVEKGTALRKLKAEMGVTGPIMYLGDSEADDPAFQLAEISVGVKHTRIMPALQCKYRLEFVELETFLSNLIEADFDFKEDMLESNTPQ